MTMFYLDHEKSFVETLYDEFKSDPTVREYNFGDYLSKLKNPCLALNAFTLNKMNAESINEVLLQVVHLQKAQMPNLRIKWLP